MAPKKRKTQRLNHSKAVALEKLLKKERRHWEERGITRIEMAKECSTILGFPISSNTLGSRARMYGIKLPRPHAPKPVGTLHRGVSPTTIAQLLPVILERLNEIRTDQKAIMEEWGIG